jgi:hypothetical protein
VHTFLEAFKAIGQKPDAGDDEAWDAGLIVIDAFKKVGLDASATQIQNYISTLRGWVGTNGVYDFVATPQRGVGLESLIVERWDAQKDAWVGVSRSGGWPLKR